MKKNNVPQQKKNRTSLQESLNLAASGKLTVDQAADAADAEQGNLATEAGYSSIDSSTSATTSGSD